MERLSGERSVDRRVREGDLLGPAGERLRLGYDPLENRTHPVERLDRDHARIAAHQHARELPRAGAEIEHRRIG